MKIVSDLSLTGRPIRRASMASRLVLDFTTGALPDGVSFTRAGSATYFDAAGVLQTALADVPRFDHDPVAWALRGLLVEPSATNRLLNSGFAGAAVGTPGTVPTSWQLNASGGSITVASGGEIGLSATAARQIIGPTFALALDEVVTFAVTVTANPNGNVFRQIASPVQSGGASASVTRYYANGIEVDGLSYVPAAGDRLRFTLTMGGGEGSYTFRVGMGCIGPATGEARFTRPQLEAGATETTYIPTTTAAATRAADQPRITANLGTRDVRVTTEAGVQVLTAQALTGNYWPALTGPQRIRQIEVL